MLRAYMLEKDVCGDETKGLPVSYERISEAEIQRRLDERATHFTPDMSEAERASTLARVRRMIEDTPVDCAEELITPEEIPALDAWWDKLMADPAWRHYLTEDGPEPLLD